MPILSQSSGLKAGPSPGTLMPMKGQEPLFPAGDTPGFTSRVRPQPCCLPLLCPAAQHSWGTDRHTALSCHGRLPSCPGEVMVSNPVTPRKAARGQNQSQSQVGPLPTLLFVIILTPRSRNPLQTEHQSFRPTSHNKSQPTGFQRELALSSDPT